MTTILTHREYDIENPLHKWLKFFDKAVSEEELKELIQVDEAIATAEKRIKRAQYSQEELRKYHSMEDAEREYISAINYATRKGLSEGEARGSEEEASRFAKLVKFLLEESRHEDLIEISQNPELRQKYYKEFNI